MTHLALGAHLLRADARANRDRIVVAAREVFREHGLDAEMKEVAARAEVSIGTLYRNFPTRDDLVAAMFGECQQRFGEILERAAEAPNFLQAIEIFFRHGFGLAEEFGAMTEGLQHGLPPPCEELMEDVDMTGGVEALLRRGIAEGVLRPDLAVDIAAASVLASFEGSNYAALRKTRSADEIVAAYLDLFLRATRA